MPKPKSVINIRKEIAFSILNVGEVLASTIDYYLLDTEKGQAEELKELIKLSDQQAALQRQQKISEIPKVELEVSVPRTDKS